MPSPHARIAPQGALPLTPTPAPAAFRVLFVYQIGASHLDDEALGRAHTLSQAFRGEVFVLRVLPGYPRHQVLMPHLSLLSTMGDLAEAHEAGKTTLAQCTPVTPGIGRQQILVRQGHYLQQVRQAAHAIDAALIVLPSQPGVAGREVAWLASTAQVPVLVLWHASTGEAIVAATDLIDPRYPVLLQAAEWSRRLEVPLVCVHNLPARAPAPARPRRATRLLSVTASLSCSAEGVISRYPTPTEAILGEARAREADLVVVGARPRSWFERLTSRSVAACVVDEARRSVLVTPIAAA